MNKHNLAGLAVKLLAVFLLIKGVSALAAVATLQAISSSQTDTTYAINVSNLIAYILMGIILWFFSPKLAGFISKGENIAGMGDFSISAEDLQRVLFSVLGLYFVGRSLPQIVSTLTSLFALQNPSLFRSSLPYLMGNITELIVGLIIFLSPQGLINLVKAIKTLGVNSKDGEGGTR
ncbi:MAG TPA: hypothetical protein GXX46_01655 [Peptococcaceae bacterium]|nr:hypothetical protein [Peptococcaceae bacterium]